MPPELAVSIFIGMILIGPPNFPVCYMTLFPSDMTLELYFDPMVSDLSRLGVREVVGRGAKSQGLEMWGNC